MTIMVVVMPKASFTDQIRDAVRASGISQTEICEKIELDNAVMSRFLAGKSFLSERSMNALAAMLGLNVAAKGRRSKTKER
jgi:ribosome-binding protein aMBF1 (putative translation factor)